ncbi:GspH/FimT family pseudopilin [Methylobacter sp. Wu1]|uniref:GspH/FimT family pseudopilin n=1 Tax=Methylobacter sp. Wu1 TaxID=3119359 RepID=UPI002F92C2D1
MMHKTEGSGLSSKRAVGLRLPAHWALSRTQGFTLLELMVVLFVIILGFSIVAFNLSSGRESTQLRAAARDIVSALRYARGQALLSHQQTTVALDLGDNSYQVSGRDKVFTIPESIDLSLVTAQDELTGEGQGNIRFFADGSSTGGRVTLEWGGSKWRIDINWLTGQVELEDASEGAHG